MVGKTFLQTQKQESNTYLMDEMRRLGKFANKLDRPYRTEEDDECTIEKMLIAANHIANETRLMYRRISRKGEADTQVFARLHDAGFTVEWQGATAPMCSTL